MVFSPSGASLWLAQSVAAEGWVKSNQLVQAPAGRLYFIVILWSAPLGLARFFATLPSVSPLPEAGRATHWAMNWPAPFGA